VLSEASGKKVILNAFGKTPQDLKTRGIAGLFYSKSLVICHFGDFIPCSSKMSGKKGKSPLEFTGKAYIFVSSDIHPKILSIKNLSCAN